MRTPLARGGSSDIASEKIVGCVPENVTTIASHHVAGFGDIHLFRVRAEAEEFPHACLADNGERPNVTGSVRRFRPGPCWINREIASGGTG